jgi:hypothetical protein
LDLFGLYFFTNYRVASQLSDRLVEQKLCYTIPIALANCTGSRQSSMKLLRVLLIAVAGCVFASSAPTLVPLTGAKDFLLFGGASVTANTILNLRSGVPNTKTSALVVTALQPGAVVTSLSFSYRYCFGFATTGVGSNFTLKLGPSAAYASPHFTDYPYNKGSDPNKVYSPPVNVTVDTLSITIPSSGVSRIEFDFENVARNVQLMLPMIIIITCAGGSCLKPTPPPTPVPAPTPDACKQTPCNPACTKTPQFHM